MLKEAGVSVKLDETFPLSQALISPYTVFKTEKRPYIILKWAESVDGFIGRKDEQIWLSNSYVKRPDASMAQ